MKNRLKYKEIKDGKFSLKEFKKFFILYMNYEQYLLNSKTEIVGAALSYINFKIKSSEKSNIEKYALKVLRCFESDFKYIDFENKPIHRFFSIILGLHCKPIKYKYEIELQVKSDLWRIEELIERYRQEKFIKDFELNSYTPRNQHEKTEIAFFLRAKQKYKEVGDYLIKDLDIRAINKALDKRPENIEEMYKDLVEKKDYPYYEHIYKNKIVYDIDYEKIDSQKINLLKNKWSYLGYCVSYVYDNKTYEEIIKKVNASNLISKLNEQFNLIPTLKERKPIFKELKLLFENENYYGFYALAIPQIEGLFADMIYLIEPDSKKLSKSLVEKISHISSFYKSSNFYFDYYMYFLPKQRNKFSHSGKDKNIKGKSFQILLDLLHIISIYSEIDSPVNKLNNTINDGLLHFVHIGNYADFLVQLSKSKRSQKFNLIEKKTNKFAQKLFASGSKIEGFLDLLFEDFKNAFTSFDEYLQLFAERKDKVNLKKQSMQSIVENISFFEKEILARPSILFEEDFKVLADTITFIKKYPKTYKNLNKKIDKKIKEFAKEEKSKIDKIYFLNSKLDIELPSYFSLKKKELQHITLYITP